MARCPYCDAELPGMEKICPECWEKSGLQKKVKFGDWAPGVALLALIIAGMAFLPARALAALESFRAFVLATDVTVKVTLAGVAAGFCIWESWRWKSWWRLLFWTSGIFAVVGLVLWTGSASRAWQATCIGTFGLSIVAKVIARLKAVREN